MKLPKEQKPKLESKQKAKTPLLLPHEPKPKSQPEPQTASRKTISAHSEPATGDIEKTIANKSIANKAIDEKVLFERLKDLRKKLATEENVPAYIIFTNASLLDMCRRKPTSLIQFSAVNGVGEVKLEKYGEAFIDVIKSLL
jgi:ATP-dependent DNA helicase RecQ